jgi:hypothetical protein
VPGLVASARIALDLGLRVWLQPRLVNASSDQALSHLAEAAAAAERLRAGSHEVVLNTGCEYSLYITGIGPGRTARDNGFPLGSSRWWALLPLVNRRLNVFLGQVAATARANFGGRITYASGFWEKVDWTAFDIVGVNYYRHEYNQADYRAGLRRMHRDGKPVAILEFGCGSYAGAAEDGPRAHGIIDWTGAAPKVRSGFVRDESVQARYLAELLDIYLSEGVSGAFVFEFADRSRLHSHRPARDLDMAGYAITRVTGDGGESWVPKAAFHELGGIYGGLASSSGVPPARRPNR